MRTSKTQDGHGMNDVVWFNSHSSPVKNATIPTKRWIVLFTRKAMFEKGHGKVSLPNEDFGRMNKR